MKVGILTFHNALNFGATLQAYALCTYINSLGISADVINYLNPKMKDEIKPLYYPKNLSPASRVIRTLGIPTRLKSISSYRAFFENYMLLSGSVISSTKELTEVTQRYDRIVVGSDQIFNYRGTGEDFNFYLQFLNDAAKKIAYAPSFGLKTIDDEHKELVRNCLTDFAFLSAREQTGVEIMRELTGKSVPLVCDPTFLLTKSQWETLAHRPKISQPYVLVYAFGATHLDEKAKELAKNKNAVVVDINRCLPTFRTEHKNIYGINPADFLGLIANADHIVTCSFHGMALSTLLEKDFTVYLNDYAHAENTNLRFTSLAEKLGLEGRIRRIGEEACTVPIDYRQVNERIATWRGESQDYLKEALGIK